jgi:hypothetical protein
MKLVTEAAADLEVSPRLKLDDLPPALLRQIAETYQQAQRFLREAAVLVRQQQELEGALIALGGFDDEDNYDHLRETSGLTALDSVLGNAAAAISAPGGGLWCGGPPRPWPETAWKLEETGKTGSKAGKARKADKAAKAEAD